MTVSSPPGGSKPNNQAPAPDDVFLTLKRVKEWFASKGAQEVLDNLQDGASEQALSDAEQRLGVALPADLRALYRLQNGQREIELGNQFFPYGIGAFLDVQSAVRMSPRELAWFVSPDSGHEGIPREIQPLPERPLAPSRFSISKYAKGSTELRADECSTAWLMFAWQDTFAGWVNLRSGRVFSWAKDEGLKLEAVSFGVFFKQFADDLHARKHRLVRDDAYDDEPVENRPWRWDD